jgi:hypothetical protein
VCVRPSRSLWLPNPPLQTGDSCPPPRTAPRNMLMSTAPMYTTFPTVMFLVPLMLQWGTVGASGAGGGGGGGGAGVGFGVGAGGGGGPSNQHVVQPAPPAGAGHFGQDQHLSTPRPGYRLPGPHSQM